MKTAIAHEHDIMIEETPRIHSIPFISQLISWIMIALNETHKGLIVRWSYKFDMITEIVTLGFLFIGITFFTGGGELDASVLAASLLGYGIWFYATVAIGEMSWSLRDEAQSGTLEQMYMSVAPAGIIRLGRTLSTLLTTSIVVIIMSTILIVMLDINIPFRWAGLPIFGLTLLGVYGFGFIIGGLTLLFKQVGSLANMVQNLLLFLNGAFLPVDQLPAWLQAISRTLPTTEGIIILRSVVLDGQPLTALWTDGSLVWLVIHSVGYFVIGWVIFSFCEQVAKKQGKLGQY